MKLKVYLRGLAVGIILTTIILSIANAGNKPLTDTEIRKRALELGMVEGDSVKLSDVAESNNAAESSDAESSESDSPSIEVESTENTKTIDETTVEASAPGKTPASVESSEATELTETTVPITITIKSGDSSYTVSKALAASGLVEDAVEFDNYLCDNGYSRTIRTGTYELLPGATYEEIAKKIAR